MKQKSSIRPKFIEVYREFLSYLARNWRWTTRTGATIPTDLTERDLIAAHRRLKN